VSGKEIAEKTCASCGRRIQWRAKWATNWAEVRYCSDACRSRRVSAADLALEADILARLGALPRGRTIPSAPDEPSRRAARRLTAAGRIELLQSGRLVDPSTAKGEFQLRLLDPNPAGF
jgi:hypothetical protein